MKRIMIVLLCLVLCGCSPGIEVVEEYESSFIRQETVEDLVTGDKWFTEYDESLVRGGERIRYLNGEEIGRDSYEYDDCKHIIRITSDSGCVTEFDITYDSEMWMVGRTTTVDGVVTCVEVFADRERILERSEYDGDVLVRKTVTEYREDGTRKKVTVFGPDGTIMEYAECSTEKSVETELRYAADGTYQGKSVYTISSHDKPAREEVYNADGDKVCTKLWLYGTYRRTEYGTNE